MGDRAACDVRSPSLSQLQSEPGEPDGLLTVEKLLDQLRSTLPGPKPGSEQICEKIDAELLASDMELGDGDAPA